MERVLSLDRVAPLPSGNCGASFNDDIGIGARQIQKSQSASAFICDYLVSWLADRHRRCKRAVPCVQDMLEDFKELRGAIQKKAKTAHNFQDFERMVPSHPLNAVCLIILLQDAILCINRDDTDLVIELKRVVNLLPDSIRRIPEHLRDRSHEKVLNQLLQLNRVHSKARTSQPRGVPTGLATMTRSNDVSFSRCVAQPMPAIQCYVDCI